MVNFDAEVPKIWPFFRGGYHLRRLTTWRFCCKSVINSVGARNITFLCHELFHPPLFQFLVFSSFLIFDSHYWIVYEQNSIVN